MRKKVIVGMIVFILVLGTYHSLAKEKNPEELGRSIAQGYLDNSLVDDNWKSSHPYISEEYSYLTDKDTPSYKEYKISCDKNPNCGWIIVNVDGDDVAIPIASTQGSANYELLSQKLDGKLEKKNVSKKGKVRKAFYFSPFEQYIQDENGEVEQYGIQGNQDITLKDVEVKVQSAKEFKKTEKFKNKRKELEEQNLTSFSRNKYFGILNTYASATSIPNKFVTGAIITDGSCNSIIPCYKQWSQTYTGSGGGYCDSGCSPTAVGMVFGYHDRRGTFYPNLVSGTAAGYITGSGSSANITTMINSIRSSIGTYCSGTGGATTPKNIKLGVAYAISKGYTSATGSFQSSTPSFLLGGIKFEIDYNRPVVLSIQNTVDAHSIVGYGYSTDTSSRMLRVNYGRGAGSVLTGSQLSSFADVSIDSMLINKQTGGTGAIVGLTRFRLGGAQNLP